ncbi:paraquat-inducible protein A [Pseudooceanicola algae]|uniref:Uncharacterized protein n=1 Tax=Pseudooceanicola algae TaxID=1537215 RepID=A0A418SF18_9RHOB|nr:paraquat-inducible protein A [Pseudooceanicola algae]QPM89314.1 hypothetical protein PSAL_005290 [Pseudooceanicola algae]
MAAPSGPARLIFLANLLLLLIYPISWFAPLARAGVLPIFGLAEISIISSLAAIWGSDPFLALLVAFLAMMAPLAKTLGLTLVLLGRANRRWLPWIRALGRLAMADIFLIALYISLVKGLGYGHVETAWGLWLFTGCTLASLALSALTKRSFGATLGAMPRDSS